MAKEDPIDPDAVRAIEGAHAQNEKITRNQQLADIRWLMSHKEGRRVMYRLLDKAGIYRTTFRMNSEMPFLEGMRNMGLMFIVDVQEECPGDYLKMMAEEKANRLTTITKD